jgi:predicted transcriptional regulator YdeE
MKIYNLPNVLKVFGFRVNSFPEGIAEAFESLIKMVPDGFERPYYGIGYMDKDGQIIYKAAALEKYEAEAEKYKCERYTIEKGEYLTVTVHDWHKKTSSIKNVFHEIMLDSRVDKTKPCVEWYKNDDEMICMIQTDRRKNEIAG